jgi:hypothetical protein
MTRIISFVLILVILFTSRGILSIVACVQHEYQTWDASPSYNSSLVTLPLLTTLKITDVHSQQSLIVITVVSFLWEGVPTLLVFIQFGTVSDQTLDGERIALTRAKHVILSDESTEENFSSEIKILNTNTTSKTPV